MTAVRLAADGARVFAVGRRQDDLSSLEAEVGPAVTGVRADVSNLADLDKVYEAIIQHGKGLDVLVANAGGGAFVTLEDLTPDAAPGGPRPAWISSATCSLLVVPVRVDKPPSEMHRAMARSATTARCRWSCGCGTSPSAVPRRVSMASGSLADQGGSRVLRFLGFLGEVKRPDLGIIARS